MTESPITHLMHRQPESRFAACSSDACRQGRDKCPCPTACETADDDMKVVSTAILHALAIAIGLLSMLCAVLPAFYWA